MCCGLTQQAVKYHVVAPSPSPISEMKERIGKKKKKNEVEVTDWDKSLFT